MDNKAIKIVTDYITSHLDKSDFVEKNVDGDRLWEEWLPSVVGIFRLLKTSIGTH